MEKPLSKTTSSSDFFTFSAQEARAIKSNINTFFIFI
jgi:hypothetical protein